MSKSGVWGPGQESALSSGKGSPSRRWEAGAPSASGSPRNPSRPRAPAFPPKAPGLPAGLGLPLPPRVLCPDRPPSRLPPRPLVTSAPPPPAPGAASSPAARQPPPLQLVPGDPGSGHAPRAPHRRGLAASSQTGPRPPSEPAPGSPPSLGDEGAGGLLGTLCAPARRRAEAPSVSPKASAPPPAALPLAGPPEGRRASGSPPQPGEGQARGC